MKELLDKYSFQLSQHENGVEKRLSVEIKRREMAEKKLVEKMEVL